MLSGIVNKDNRFTVKIIPYLKCNVNNKNTKKLHKKVKKFLNLFLICMFSVILCGYNTNVNKVKQTFATGENGLKTKRVLKFYFCADTLNTVFDRAILFRAYASAGSAREGGVVAEEICKLIESKQKLHSLWLYLNGVINTFDEKEKEVLKFFALYRGGEEIEEEKLKRIKSVAMKFRRRARGLDCFKEEFRIVEEYYGVMG
jgi:hypothetical protein